MKTFSVPGHGPSWGRTGFCSPSLRPDSLLFSPQLELITTQATKAGFTGGVVVDFPNSAKAKK